MTQAYANRMKDAHWTVRHALTARNMALDGADGKVLATMVRGNDPTVEKLTTEALDFLGPQHRTPALTKRVTQDFEDLLRIADRIQPMSILELMFAQPPSASGSLPGKEPDTRGVPSKIIMRWRRVTELPGPNEEPAFTQRELEAQLSRRWRDRILSHFMPHAGEFENLLIAIKEDDKVRACHDLFGTMRHTTLAAMCRGIEAILRLHPTFIPWNQDKIGQLYNTVRDMDVNANKPVHWQKCIRKLGDTLGRPYPQKNAYLKNKLDMVRAQLSCTTHRVDRRALAPGLDVPKALETATTRAQTTALQWVASCLRFCLGASARINDCQHVAPSTRYITHETVEFHPWQTKVSSITFNNRPMPLIAPLHSYSGVPWWKTFNEGLDAMQKDTFMANRDFMLPDLTKDHAAFRKRPMQNTRLLKIYRTLLVQGGMDLGEAVKHTLPGLRVFMAEQAYQAGVSRDLRRYIGRWASDSTADVYTREHRKVIVNIWKEVTNKDTAAEAKMVPLDVAAPYYDIEPAKPKEAPSGGQTAPDAVVTGGGKRVATPKRLPARASESPAGKGAGETSQAAAGAVGKPAPAPPPATPKRSRARESGSPTGKDAGETSQAAAGADGKPSPAPQPAEKYSKPRLPLGNRQLAHEVSRDKGGPLHVYVMNNDTGIPPSRKRHLVYTMGEDAGTTAGCGKKLKPERCRWVQGPAAMQELQGPVKDCDFCFRAYKLATEWNVAAPEAPQTQDASSDSTLSTGSDTDDESDTDSDASAVDPTPANRRGETPEEPQ